MECNSILFVCLGNICRSPLAEAIAKKEAQKRGLNILIDSCGTSHHHVGEPPCLNSQKVAAQNGIDIRSQRARQLCQEDFTSFDIIVGLDQNNVKTIQQMGGKDIYKLGDFGFDGACVPDPYYFSGFEGFDKVYSMIESCVKELFDVKVTQTY